METLYLPEDISIHLHALKVLPDDLHQAWFVPFHQNPLMALVPTALWRAVKKNGPTRRSETSHDAREEQKRSRFEQSTLRIKNFKYGPSLSIFVQKNNEAQQLQVSQFFTLTNKTAREFDSGLGYG